MRATSALFLTFAFALLLFLISFMGQNDLALPTEASSPITDRYSVLATRKMFQQPNFNMSNFIPSFKKLTYNPLPLHRVNEDSLELESGNKNVTTGTTQSLLSCQESFPPKCDIYPYVKFWNQRFLEEDCYYSPLRHPLGKKAPASETKYLVFQSDGGGWNNIRMAAETAMVFAHATGRTLVMPPSTTWYLLDKNKDRDENESNYDKFFDFEKVSESLDIITMEEFVKTVAAKGLLKIALPPEASKAKWIRDHKGLWSYMEEACHTRKWEPGKMFIGLNISSVDMDVDGSVHTRTSTDSTLVSAAKSLRGVVSNGSQPRSLTSDSLASRSRARKRGVMNSIQEDAHSRQFASHKRTLVTYDETFHQEKAIFFPGDYRNEYRMLTHFYAYLYFADEHTEHIYMRIVRDRLHYHDEIFCAAGRAIKLLHEEAAELATLALVKGKVKGPERDDNGNLVAVGEERSKVQTHVRANILTGGGDVRHDAVYHAVHIRRGDFQYSHTQLPAATLYNNIKHLLDPNVTKILYISTDEKNMNFFEPFRKHFTLRFLHHLTITAHLGDHHLNQNHIGMVEQTICANAHTFVGTPMSTFTGYITRMRGYYRDDRYKRTFYTMREHMYQLQTNPNLVGPFWAREFAVAHADIDDYSGQ